MGYFKAKVRGAVVYVIILFLAVVFGWSTGTTQIVIEVVFTIGFIMFILSLFNRS